MKKFILILILISSIFAKQNENNNSTILDDIINIIPVKFDENLSDKLKLETIENYISNVKFNDKFNKKELNFNIMGHYENYILMGGHSSNKLIEKHWVEGIEDTYNPNGTFNNGYERDTNEAQFQLSIKVPLYKNFLSSNGDLYTAYTQNSYWQVYDKKHSSPFRETNYMPELFVDWDMDKKLGSTRLKEFRLSFIHQSNGQDVGASRSWNRTELYFLLQKDNFYYGLHIWDRWDEDTKKDITKTEGDDNPDLEKYIGKQKYFVKYKGESINLTLTHQNDITAYDINRGNTKLDCTFPSINNNFDFFIRYFNGYGESLIDYNVKIDRVSFGIMISDWI
ncbi:MAG: phospholipase A [Arcobacteraceae bacterium]|nr:phospholipase A [Arcobacteraceae bacterium]